MFNLSVQNSGPYDRKLIELDTIDRWALIVEATIDSGDLAFFQNAAAGFPVAARMWVGVDDPLVHRIELGGPIAAGEAETILRRLELSRFNEDVDIVPPR